MDYVDAQLIIRLSDQPEFEVCQDKVWMISSQSETDGYAREDDRWILAAGQTVVIDFDAFKDCDWLDLVAQNEGANPADITLIDDAGVRFTLPIPVNACLLVRCYKEWVKPGDEPTLYSALGTRVRVFAWGEHWEGEPV